MSERGASLFNAFSKRRSDYVLLYAKASAMAHSAKEAFGIPEDRIHCGSVDIKDIEQAAADGFPFCVYYAMQIDLPYEIVIGWIPLRETDEAETLLLRPTLKEAREAVLVAPRRVHGLIGEDLDVFYVNGHLIAVKGVKTAEIHAWARGALPKLDFYGGGTGNGQQI